MTSTETLLDAPLPDWAAAAAAMPSRSRRLDVEGSNIHFLAWGDPALPPLVLVHGNAASAEWWRFVAPLLTVDHHVIAPDLGGMGDSGHDGRYERERYARQVLAVAEAAAPGRAPVLVGHSLGGYVAIMAARAAGQGVAGLVVLDSPLREPKGTRAAPRIQPAALTPFPTREAALARFRVLPEQPVGCDFYLLHIARHAVAPRGDGWWWKFDPAALSQPRRLDFEADIRDMRCPVALMWGDASRRFDADARAWTRRAFGGRLPLVEIAHAGHHLMLDEPLALVAALRTQLANWRLAAPR